MPCRRFSRNHGPMNAQRCADIMSAATRSIRVFSSAVLLALPLILTGCVHDSVKSSGKSRGTRADIGTQLEACRREHERQVSNTAVEALRADLRRYAELANQDALRQRAMQQAMDEYARGVCLIHGIFTLYERRDQESVQVTDAEGEPLTLDYLGSGFLVSQHGHILTNRHVAEPWWNNENVAPLMQRGFEPAFIRLTVTFPSKAPIPVDPATIHVSAEGVDLAVLRVQIEDVPALPLSSRDPRELRGQRLMLLGYPTGLSALLARAEPDVVAAALTEARDTTTLIAALSSRSAITPVITHGTLNDATDYKLIYDAVTTSGGSGGPVFGPDGDVIGVNFAILRDFQGSNFGVPIRFSRSLIP